MPISDFNQRQNEALIRLLIAATYGDGHLSIAEEESFEDMVDSLRWESGSAQSIFIAEATAEVRAIHEDEGTSSPAAYVKEQCGSFDSDVTKATALDLIEHLFASDGLELAEGTLLKVATEELGGTEE